MVRYETVVSEVITRTYNVRSARFPRLTSFNYKAGQYMFATFKSDENKLTKHLSISSSPTEKDFIEFTKKLTGSEFSNAVDSLKRGDWAEINGPYGKFSFEGEYRKLGMLSGGIGITPLRSICRYCADVQSDTDIVLLYANHDEKGIIFRDELENMQVHNKNFRLVLTLDRPPENWAGQTGRIDAKMVKREIPDYLERVFYTCGPPGMVMAMVSLLKELGLNESQIKDERFSGYE
jgi:ferredoxin-NADP reductase